MQHIFDPCLERINTQSVKAAKACSEQAREKRRRQEVNDFKARAKAAEDVGHEAGESSGDEHVAPASGSD